MGRQSTTYRIRYWLGGKVHHTSSTYMEKRKAQDAKVKFAAKHPGLKVKVVKQTYIIG